MEDLNKNPGAIWYELVAKSWTDPALREELLSNPTATVQKYGMVLPKGMEIAVVENTDELFYLVLPEKPSDVLTAEDIDAIAGSGTTLSHC